MIASIFFMAEFLTDISSRERRPLLPETYPPKQGTKSEDAAGHDSAVLFQPFCTTPVGFPRWKFL
jgi:hypothetical protein